MSAELREYAKMLANELSETVETPVADLDVLDALAVHGLTLVTAFEGESTAAYMNAVAEDAQPNE